MRAQLVPQQLLTDVPSGALPEQLTQPRELVRQKADNKVQIRVGQDFNNCVNLYFNL